MIYIFSLGLFYDKNVLSKPIYIFSVSMQ